MCSTFELIHSRYVFLLVRCSFLFCYLFFLPPVLFIMIFFYFHILHSGMILLGLFISFGHFSGCTTFGTTYSKTAGYELFGQHLWLNISLLDTSTCEQECNKHTFCKVYVWNFLIGDCFILDVSLFDVPGSWTSNAFMEYWQRNCIN